MGEFFYCRVIMKKKHIRNQELEELGRVLNEKVNLFSLKLARIFNQFFLNKRKLTVVLLALLFIIALIINLLSFFYL
jgi:hypothetical protein